MPVITSEWVVQDLIEEKKISVLQPPSKKRKGDIASSRSSAYGSHERRCSSITNEILCYREYGHLGNSQALREDICLQAILRLRRVFTVQNLIGKGYFPCEIFGKDYPLEYSPDGRFLLGLTVPLRDTYSDLFLLDSTGRRLHTVSDLQGYKHFMFTWTSEQQFVTGALVSEGEEMLHLWDVRNLSHAIFSQKTESSLGFEVMEDPVHDRKWLIGVHTEKMFGGPTGRFSQWSTINVNQANINGLSSGHLDIHTQAFSVFGVEHSAAHQLQHRELPYVDGGLVKYDDESLVIVVESVNQSDAFKKGWPRFEATVSKKTSTSLPFATLPRKVTVSNRDDSVFWMEGLHADPTGNGFLIASRHSTLPSMILRNPRPQITDSTSYYAINEKNGQFLLNKTATMPDTVCRNEPHPEWKKPNHYRFAPNGRFFGRIDQNKLKILVNGTHAQPFRKCLTTDVMKINVINEVAFNRGILRNFAVSPADNMTCAVSCDNGSIHIVQPVW